MTQKIKLPEQWLKEKLPENYISKWVFWVALLILFLSAFYIFFLNDFDFSEHYIISCTDNKPCLNMYYFCSHNTNDILKTLNGCDSLDYEKVCQQGLCEKEYLQPGESIGKDDGGIIRFFKVVTLLTLFFAFFVNHIIYLRSRGRKHGDGTDSKNRERKTSIGTNVPRQQRTKGKGGI